MKISYRLARRYEYMKFDEAEFRKVVLAVCRHLKQSRNSVSPDIEEYIDFCDEVRVQHPRDDGK
ncbi:hypothetical protein [Thalassospira xiamenensis]|uniref:hypothetical protein n=1 Tax=Thalassospira xiamenensis TaxID=220697 RepID=UPI001C688B5A|nr:hypothetical protein [Thalassospira xiamenensis]